MMRGNITTATLAGLAIVSVAASYLIKGTVPDILTILSTTIVGGYLGLTSPNTPTT